MPKKKLEEVLGSILEEISNTQHIVNKSLQLRELLKKVNLQDHQHAQEFIEKTKVVVDNLKEETLKIDGFFYQFYSDSDNNTLGVCSIGNAKDSETYEQRNLEEDLPKQTETTEPVVQEFVDVNQSCDMMNNLIVSMDENRDTHITQISESEGNINNTVDDSFVVNEQTGDETSEVNNESNEKVIGGEKSLKETVKKSETKSIENSKISENGNKPLLEENVSQETNVLNKPVEKISENDKRDNNEEVNINTALKEIKDEKVWNIKCIDITKLMEPNSISCKANSRSSLKNQADTSVVVISDSDSECYLGRSTRRKLNKIDELLPKKHSSQRSSERISKINHVESGNTKTLQEKTVTEKSVKTPNTKKKKSVTFRDPETSDIDDDYLFSYKTGSKLPTRKKKPINFYDISSLSEDSDSSLSDVASTKKKSRLSKYKNKENRQRCEGTISQMGVNVANDIKFSQQCIIKLLRLSPEQLKANYQKFQLKNDVIRLTNMKSLKRSRKERRDSPSYDSSTSEEEPAKKRKCEQSKSTSKANKNVENMDLEHTSDKDSNSSDVPDMPTDSNSLSNVNDLNESHQTSCESQDITIAVCNAIVDTIHSDSDDTQHSKSDKESGSASDGEDKETKSSRSEERRLHENENKDEVMELNEAANKDKRENESDDHTSSKKKKSSKWRQDQLLTEKFSDTESEVDAEKVEDKSDNHKIAKESLEENEKDCSDSSTDDENFSTFIKKKKQNDKQNAGDKNGESNETDEETDCTNKADHKTKKQKDREVHNEKTSSETKSCNKESSNDSDSIATSNIKRNSADQDSSDTDNENFAAFLEKQEKRQEKSDAEETAAPKKNIKRFGKKRKRAVVDSDSSKSGNSSSGSEKESLKNSSESSSEGENEAEKKKEQKKERRRIKKLDDSSDEEEDKSTRKHIRKVLSRNSLSESTIQAEKEEAERKVRILEKQKKYNQIFDTESLQKATVDKVVLDFNDSEEILKIDNSIVKYLKPHQANGIQFMWNASFESVDRAQKEKGSGCILAHCMGLGKTLQVIALIHTLISNSEKTKVEKVMVVCPLSTVLNWVAEFKKWITDEDEVNVFEIVSFKQNAERLFQIKEWDRCGGALILGYDMFRNLTNPAAKRMSKKMKASFQKYLVDPGPDVVICDEGHLLKNEKTSLSIAMNRLRTARRIVLTGTPLQNNLKEYWCMVQFVKPNLLGTYKEYMNRFVNPITNGQYTDSTPHDTLVMRKRSHVLHKLLDGVVQRRDYNVLAPFLPPKYEYVLFVNLTETQIKLYDHYIQYKARQQLPSGRSSFLFIDFQELQRICTHPRVLLDKSIENKIARDRKELFDDEESEGSLKDFIDDNDTDKSDTHSESSDSSESDSGSGSNSSNKKSTKRGRVTRSAAASGDVEQSDEEDKTAPPDPQEWWRQFITEDGLDDIMLSGKLSLVFEILKQCEMIGDKILIFSQSLYSLNVLEYFLNKIDDATQNSETGTFCGFSGSWSLGLDYFRLDGSSSCDKRAAWCKTFNNPDNTRARLFLISTRAGGLGINLVAANRVIVFDVSWNPSYDTQSIYRVYRFGQNKPCFIYRFVTMGTMEMKIYERQVIKQSISKRVIDEQQIDRHYNQNDLAELYKFEPKPEEGRPIPLVPKDVLLGELLQADDKIYKYHEHQSLLENKEDEVLDEAERKAAWEEFENEKKARKYSGSINHIPMQSIVKALTSMVLKDNPITTPEMIRVMMPNLVQQLQDQMAAGDNTLYMKVLSELRFLEQQRLQEYNMFQQQQQNMLFRQYQQQLLNNPSAAQLMNQWSQAYNAATNQQQNNLPRMAPARFHPNDIIDLND